MTLPPLPLLHDPDSFVIYLDDSPLRILSITRFSNNQNTQGEQVLFYSLDEETRRAVLQQINRRYPGKVIRVQ